jgi:hypothetical protein
MRRQGLVVVGCLLAVVLLIALINVGVAFFGQQAGWGQPVFTGCYQGSDGVEFCRKFFDSTKTYNKVIVYENGQRVDMVRILQYTSRDYRGYRLKALGNIVFIKPLEE